MSKFYNSNKIIINFFLKASGLYLVWFFVYTIWTAMSLPADNFLIRHLIWGTSTMLNIFGFETFNQDTLVGICNSSGLIISSPCNGLSLFALFAGFIIAFPGNVISKFIFIPIGIIIIDIINIFRIVALSILAKFAPQTIAFNHSYTFTLIMYAIIFFMWMWWIKKYAQKGNNKETQEGAKNSTPNLN